MREVEDGEEDGYKGEGGSEGSSYEQERCVPFIIDR